MKKTTAETDISIWLECPYCNKDQDRLDSLREHLDEGELRADTCDAVLLCVHCDERFEVTEITY